MPLLLFFEKVEASALGCELHILILKGAAELAFTPGVLERKRQAAAEMLETHALLIGQRRRAGLSCDTHDGRLVTSAVAGSNKSSPKERS
ncbi:hypothetical protein HL667_32200 [Bradyrhizobium sp. 83012]|uniref:Uncharacterized protein n=1 Tax=Bradyrhizobium aeschynomenes TaxID=2734909 RepID=A0ABX2CQU3_9BRAD|nr:hypothetical protein [Bradyrhizobium aeschynomenes]NPU15640.1 hypothetical protein [Bradyrhizobium aeschynomenes]NPU69697.1 hypothetical protein [Bradyrhizobium aeschynomenes]NPV24638.1 hypothetical protein [Bradyrhizobium aeschynomenes]